jgi:hypothetical protein
MKVRFQADADFNEDIIFGVIRAEPAVDFQTAAAIGLRGLRVPDDRVLELAAGEGRVLVSHDWETMPYHFAEFIAARTSPGLLIVPQHLGVRVAIEQLVMIWAASEAEEYVNRLVRLPF